MAETRSGMETNPVIDRSRIKRQVGAPEPVRSNVGGRTPAPTTGEIPPGMSAEQYAAIQKMPEGMRNKILGSTGAKRAEAQSLQRSVAALAAQRRRRDMVRSQQRLAARQQAAAAAGGTAQSSGLAGAIGAGQSTLFETLGQDIGGVKAAQRLSTLQTQIQEQEAKKAEDDAKKSIFGQVLGAGAGFLIGGPAGAAAGAKVGGAAVSIFG